jgi:hypothetical protein
MFRAQTKHSSLFLKYFQKVLLYFLKNVDAFGGNYMYQWGIFRDFPPKMVPEFFFTKIWTFLVWVGKPGTKTPPVGKDSRTNE